jgi:CHASE2 domain-containing sensor protein
MAKSRKRRKRRAPGPRPGASEPAARTGAEPAARRTARDERPQAPWGSFPLTELTILVGLVLLVAGFVSGGVSGTLMIAVGIALAALGGLELAVREHFAGYRSHSSVLALAIAVATAAAVSGLAVLAFGSVLPVIPVAVGAVAFVPALIAMRNAFRRASGGLSFRIGRLRG